MHDLVQDERMTVLAKHAATHPGGRLRLLCVAMRRKKADGVQFLRFMLADTDERLMHMAARDRPPSAARFREYPVAIDDQRPRVGPAGGEPVHRP